MSAMAVLHLRGVTKVYHMGSVDVRALNGIDLDILDGDYVGIMGPSGSGKTTLMEILGCLSRPTDGAYTFSGERVDRLDDGGLALLRGQRIGFVFQTFNLLPRLTAIENVELPLLYRRTPRRERRRAAVEMLDRVGLGSRAAHRPNEMSGGERQRVAIARALVNQPAVLLADEPTGNLDSATGETILELFEALHHDGQTLVLVTHDPRIGERVGRVVRLRDGVVESDQRRTGISKDPRFGDHPAS
ncbi:MAG: ABC transporter ATP-binding protein [Deltaproteobacteria bacterium]|nr:ABC transporter ATP-binding protein [Deltaproteobacteria bacterium]